MAVYRLVIENERTNSVHSYLDLTLYDENGDVVESVEDWVNPVGRIERQPFKVFADWVGEVTGDEEFNYTIDEEEGENLAKHVKKGMTPEEYVMNGGGQKL